MPALRRMSLMLLLTVAAFAELWLNRVGVHWLGPHLQRGVSQPTSLGQLVNVGGLFLLYFTGLLALAMSVWAITTLVRDRQLLGPTARATVGLAAGLFIPLAAIGVVLRLPDGVRPHLNGTFSLLVVVLVVSMLSRPGAIRAKLGVLYLSVPLLLHCYWLLTRQVPQLALTGQTADLPARLYAVASQMVVAGGFVVFAAFGPSQRDTKPRDGGPLTVALAVTGVTGLLATRFFPLAALSAYHGLNIRLPMPGGIALPLHLSALFFFTLCVSRLTWRGGVDRGTALGLLLIALSGFHLQLPHLLLMTLTGLVQLMRAALTPATQLQSVPVGNRPSAEQWKAYLDRLAGSCKGVATELNAAVALQHEDDDIIRVAGKLDSVSCAVRLLVRGGRLHELEIDLGQPPKDEAPATLVRRRGCRGDSVHDGRGPRVRDFDADFVLRDTTGQAADTLAPLTSQLRAHAHGWLGLWPIEGVRYLARPEAGGWPIPVAQIAADAGEANIEPLHDLVRTLLDVANHIEVRG